jgi:hypothetical protein
MHLVMRDNPAGAITAASAVPGFSGPAWAIGRMNLLGVVPLDPCAGDALQVSDGAQLRDPEDRAIPGDGRLASGRVRR